MELIESYCLTNGKNLRLSESESSESESFYVCQFWGYEQINHVGMEYTVGRGTILRRGAMHQATVNPNPTQRHTPTGSVDQIHDQ